MTANDTPSAAEVLRDKGWIPAGVSVTRTEIAGAGNMNLVERVHLSDGGSLILKRSRGWVEKYPDISAPVERAAVEAAFYQSVRGTAAGAAMPKHLGFDASDATNLYEDLGEGRDGSFVYSGGDLPIEHVEAVADWAAALHAVPVTEEMSTSFSNMAMRELNALHIFDFPLDPQNGFPLDDITPGLQAAGDALKADSAFKTAVKSVADRYRSRDAKPGDVLLHGDLYPGSWLTTERGLFVIDPEFCWIGPPEWDLGVLAAHLQLSSQPISHTHRLLERYGRPFDRALLDQITGIEIMRRLIGVAQLPLEIDLSRKIELLDLARTLVIGRDA